MGRAEAIFQAVHALYDGLLSPVDTARWYLKQALGKTGARRQSDLLRVAAGFVLLAVAPLTLQSCALFKGPDPLQVTVLGIEPLES
jgi:hypothetical protein